MKIKYGLMLATMLCSSVVMAQVAPNTNAPSISLPPMPGQTALPDPAPPAANTNADGTVKKPASKKKHTAKKKTDSSKSGSASAKKTSTKTSATPAETAPAKPFLANTTAVAKQNNINIRAQSHINSEVVGHLKKGDTVTVIEEVTLKHAKTDEPARWVKIVLPETNHVWINTSYIDVSNAVVKAHKVNLRGGPGENYSIIGRLKAGDVIKPIDSKGDWTRIEPGTNAYAFVAAHLMTPGEPSPVPPLVANPSPAVVENPSTNFPAGNTVGQPETAAAPVPPVPIVPVPVPAPAPAVEEPPQKRIVDREGIVGGAASIQAPSHFELRSLDNGRTMDFLYSTTTNVVLKNYRGLTVLVTGEEELDERWPNTPVLTIQRIQVVK